MNILFPLRFVKVYIVFSNSLNWELMTSQSGRKEKEEGYIYTTPYHFMCSIRLFGPV